MASLPKYYSQKHKNRRYQFASGETQRKDNVTFESAWVNDPKYIVILETRFEIEISTSN